MVRLGYRAFTNDDTGLHDIVILGSDGPRE